MDREQLTVALTVAEWQAILNVLGSAPYAAVNSIGETINSLQAQAGTQIAELQKKYPAPEAPAAE